jgi:hypothetical protein
MSLKNIFLTILIVIVVAAIILFSIQENQKPKEKIDLKLRLKAGASHEVKFTHNQETLETYKNHQRKVKTHVEMVAGLEVPSVDANGTMNIDFIYKSVKLDVNSPGENINYDSAKLIPADCNDHLLIAFSDIYSAIIGTKLKIVVSPMGKAGDIEGFNDVRKKIEVLIKKRVELAAEKMRNDPNIKDKEMLKVFQESMMKDLIKEMAEYYNHILGSIITDTQEALDCIIIKYPDRQISTGNKWYDKSRLNLNMPVDANVTYIFKRKEKGIVYVDIIHDVDMGNKLVLTDVESQGKISKCISGAITATNAIDETTGLLQRSEAIMKFTGKQKIEPDNPIIAYHIKRRDIYAGPKATLTLQPGMVIPITIEGSTIIELIK